ncbi:hypothetical protein SKDZ_15G1390 [Saccharomyces kudriavzevii ZP591]|nr:hypothetical protein SKDZ_15G1390 [Saccharomyces kudriavzevii ZP591]
MFIEYSRLPGFESINVSFSRGMLRLARFANFPSHKEKLQYFKLLAGPNKYIQQISAGDFKEHPDEVNYIYIILISILQMEECMPVLVQCPTVYWVRFDWPGKEVVNTFHFASQTLTSAFNAVFTPYFEIMKKVTAKIKVNMLLFAEPRANLNNLLIKHFHDLIYESNKDETTSETILYLRTNVNIPNVFLKNKKAVFHGDSVKIGKFIGQFLSFSFKRQVKWSKLDSVDSFEITAVNYKVLVNWEKTPRKVFLPLNSDTENLRYRLKTKFNKEGRGVITAKTIKKQSSDENACINQSYSVEFPNSTSAKTEYLLKSNFSLQKINRSNDPVLQELKLNDTFSLQKETLSGEKAAFTNEMPHPIAAINGGSALGDIKYPSTLQNKSVCSGIGKTISKRTANWISSNPAPDPYGKTSAFLGNMCPDLKDLPKFAPSNSVKLLSPNPILGPEQSVGSLMIRINPKNEQKHVSFPRNYGRFKNILTRGGIKIKSCRLNQDAHVRDEREDLLQGHSTFQNKTREIFKRLTNDLHRVTNALRAAKENWDENSSRSSVH